MQPADLDFKPHGGKGIIDTIDCMIGLHVYPPPELEHYKLIFIDRFHGSTHHQTPPHDKHRKIMIRESRDVYNVFHPDSASTLNADIFQTNTYT